MRRGFIEAQQDVFGAYIDLLGQQGKAADALAVAERARARAFLDLRAERAGDARLATPASVADAQRAAARLARPSSPTGSARRRVSIWVVRPDREPALVRVPVLPSRLTALVQATAGLGGAGGAARGLLMTDRAQHAPWRELERLLIAPVRRLLPRAAGQPPDHRAARPAVRAVVRRSARRRRPDPARGARPALRAGDRRARRAVGARRAAATAGRARSSSAIPGRLQAEPGMEPLPALPWARREVAAVRAALGATARRVLTAGEANEAAVRAGAGRPARPPFRDARRRQQRDDEPVVSWRSIRRASSDGRLLADEIYDLRLDADLVVLSACRTALGPVEGDGVIGFARAFLSAGARSVVATQWDVSDRVSYEVMRQFYARRARARRRAGRCAARSWPCCARCGPAPSAPTASALPETPRLWAGFVLTGEP